MKRLTALTTSVLSVVVVVASGCDSRGSKTISRDRFNYNVAISESWKTQMLHNMVSLRYGDLPVFLDITSIASQHEWEGQADLGADYSSSTSGAVGNKTGTSVGLGGTVVDKPTITYMPIVGEDFTKSIMVPIPPGTVFYLVQAGWPIDAVFRACIQSINGVYNRDSRGKSAKPADPEFQELTEILAEIQETRLIDIRIRKLSDDIGGQRGERS